MPLEDRAAWATVLRFIGDYRPDQVIQLGHLLNLPPFGRFTGQATIELRRRELTNTADYIRHHYLSRLRTVHNGPPRIIHSVASGVEVGTLVDQHHAQPNNNGRAGGWQPGVVIVETREARVSPGCLSLSANCATVRWTGRPQTGDATTAQQHPIGRSGPDHDAGWPPGRTATQDAAAAVGRRSAIGS